MSKDLNKNTTRVGLAIMVSRVLGLIREQIFAFLFGASSAMDAFNVAFRIPNLLRDLFAEGAMSSAFVTTFSSVKAKKDDQQAFSLACKVITLLTLIIGALILLIQFFAHDLVMLYVGDFSKIPGKVAMTVTLVQIMFPFLLLVSVSSVLVGILNTFNSFGMPALAPSLFNVGTIVGGTVLAIWFDSQGWPMIYGMGIGTVIGGLLQWIFLFPLTYKVNFKFRFDFKFNHPDVINMIKLIIPAVLGLSAVQINNFVTTNFASRLDEGSISWLSYAFRLMQLPIGVFGVAIATVSLPNLSKLAAKHLWDDFSEGLNKSLRLCLLLTVPASIGLWILATPIIRCLYRWNAFTEFDVAKTAQALKPYALGLVAYSLVKVLVPAFYARKKIKIPVLGTFIAIISNIIFCQYSLESQNHGDLALAITLAATLNAGTLLIFSKIYDWKINFIELFVYLIRLLFASSIMAITVLMVDKTLANYFGQDSQLTNIISLLISISIGIVIYFITCKLIKIKEIDIMSQKLINKFTQNSSD